MDCLYKLIANDAPPGIGWLMSKRLSTKERRIAYLQQKLHDARNCLKMSYKPHKVEYWGSEVRKYESELAELVGVAEEVKPAEETKLTGSRVNYYLVPVEHPQREDQPSYMAECEDIIQALNMTFDEGCLFKALWRTAAARLGNGKPGQKATYDAEKMVHYAGRILNKTKREEA